MLIPDVNSKEYENWPTYSVLEDDDIKNSILSKLNSFNEFAVKASGREIYKSILFASNPYVFFQDTVNSVAINGLKLMNYCVELNFIKEIIRFSCNNKKDILDDLFVLILFLGISNDQVVNLKIDKAENVFSFDGISRVLKGMYQGITQLSLNAYVEKVSDEGDKAMDRECQYLYNKLTKSILTYLIHVEYFTGFSLVETLDWLDSNGFDWFTNTSPFTFRRRMDFIYHFKVPECINPYGGKNLEEIYCTFHKYEDFFVNKYGDSISYNFYANIINSCGKKFYDRWNSYK